MNATSATTTSLADRLARYYQVLLGMAGDGGADDDATNASALLTVLHAPPHNLSVDLSSLVGRRDDPGRMALLLLSYSAIVCVSLFGNVLVCHVVVRTRRLHTLTHILLANLAASDLLMTALNIPFNVARVMLDDWPFGGVMCSVVPCVQVASVCVSAFTMVAIALDRYRVIVHPLKPRLRTVHGAAILVVVWVAAALVALPYALFSKVVEVFTYRKLTRCQARYPQPALQFRRWLTLATFLVQYAVPLSVTAVAYVGVTRRVWWRAVVGAAATHQQLSVQQRTKRKTVKMLVIVVLLFAVCWLPLNAYHLVVDFGGSVGPSRHSSTVFFICHWFAMSNVCYNPFIYCWLNDHFRAGAKAWLWWVARKLCRLSGGDQQDPCGVRTSSRLRDSVTSSSAVAASLVGGRRRGASVRNGFRLQRRPSVTVSVRNSGRGNTSAAEWPVAPGALASGSAAPTTQPPPAPPAADTRHHHQDGSCHVTPTPSTTPASAAASGAGSTEETHIPAVYPSSAISRRADSQ